MKPAAHDVNDALPPKLSPRASQDVSQDTLKAPDYLVFWGFFVSGLTFVASPGALSYRRRSIVMRWSIRRRCVYPRNPRTALIRLAELLFLAKAGENSGERAGRYCLAVSK